MLFNEIHYWFVNEWMAIKEFAIMFTVSLQTQVKYIYIYILDQRLNSGLPSHGQTLYPLLRGAFNKFPYFFVQAFKIVQDSLKFSMLLLYILWDDWPSFMISSSNEQLLQELEYTLLNPNCHSWWISKIQSGREHNLEEQ